MVKLVASDLDGTLFGPRHVPEPRTVAALAAVREAGIVVTAVTGRSHLGGIDLATSTGAEFDWFIGSNGAHRLKLPGREFAEQMIFGGDEIGALTGLAADLLGRPAFGYEHGTGFSFSAEFVAMFPDGERGPRQAYDPAEFRNDDIAKILIAHPDHDGPALIEMFQGRVGDAHLTCSGAPFVEITPAGADKGSAVARLCADLGIDSADVVAFGDNHNDLTMLEWAGRGIAMANAIGQVRSRAGEVTATNADHGVAVILEELVARS